MIYGVWVWVYIWGWWEVRGEGVFTFSLLGLKKVKMRGVVLECIQF